MNTESFVFGFVDLTHPLMMAFGLATLIPILIHYWHRQSHVPIKWAATEYLQLALKKVGRRISLFQWLLLALRVALIIVLTLSLAAPWLSLSRGVHTDDIEVTRLKVIVIDTTHSMQAVEQNRTRLENAKQIASQLVENSNESDSFVVFLHDQEVTSLFTLPMASRNQVLAAIDSIRPTEKPGRLTDGLRGITDRIKQVDRSDYDRIELFWISDFASSEWGNNDSERDERWSELKDQFDLVSRHSVANARLANNYISSARFEPSVLIAGQRTAIDVVIENRGGTSRQELTVELRINDQLTSSKQVYVESNSKATVRFEPRFDRVGEHFVEIRIDDDCLPSDNRRFLTVTTRRQYQVLFVEDRAGSSRFLKLALDPSLSESSRFQMRACSPSSLARIDLANMDFVFFDNVGSLRSSDIDRLKRYVSSGHPLFVFLGDLVNRAEFNRLWNSSGDENPLELELKMLQPVEEYRLDVMEYRSRFLEVFRGNPQTGLTDLPVWCYFQVDLAKHPKWNAHILLGNGDPLLVTRSYGAGSILVFTSSSSSESRKQDESGATVSWNANETSPAFPALIQEVFAKSLESRSDSDYLVGDLWSGNLEVRSRVASSSMITLDGRKIGFELTEADGLVSWKSEALTESGFYRLSGRAGSLEFNRLVAVNIDPVESDLQVATFDEDVNTNSHLQLNGSIGNQKNPSQFFQWLLGILALLLIAETAAAFRFGRGNG